MADEREGRVRGAGVWVMACLMAACQTSQTGQHPASSVRLRTDGSYFSEGAREPSGTGSPGRSAFHVYPDLEAAYVTTSSDVASPEQLSVRENKGFGSGACLVDGSRLDCRFVRDFQAWAICGEILADAIGLSVRGVAPADENPATCPEEDRRLFRFVPQR